MPLPPPPGPRTPAVVASSFLRADPDTVWAHATSLQGINHELAPLLRVHAPAGLTSLADLDPSQVGVPLFHATVLVAGVLPVDRMQVHLVALQRLRFVERSRLLSATCWQHERQVVAHGGGCTVIDRVWVVARVPGGGLLLRPLLHRLLRHRHRRLRATFGDTG